MSFALNAGKWVTAGIVGIGTKKIVTAIIKDHVQPEKMVDKVTISAATWVLSGIATAAAKKFTNEMIDDGVKNVAAILTMIELAQKLARINENASTFEKEGLDPKNYIKDSKTGKWVAKKTIDGDVIVEEPTPQPADTNVQTEAKAS